MEQYWTAEKLGNFKLACNLILAECTTAFRAGNHHKIEELLARLEQAAPLVKAEPQRSTYEYTYCLVGLHMGILLAGMGEFDYAFVIAHYVEAIRQYGRSRRQALGLPMLPQTEVRYTLLNLLGDLKKQASLEHRDAVLTPGQMWEEWKSAATRAFEHTEPLLLKNPQRAHNVRHAVGWAGLQVIECCTRFLPQADAARMVNHFNRRFGGHLAVAPWHFRDNPVLANSAWYWDYEIYKLDFLGRLNLATLEDLWARREAAINQIAQETDYDLRGFNSNARREYRVLAEKCKLQLIGVARAS